MALNERRALIEYAQCTQYCTLYEQSSQYGFSNFWPTAK